MGLFSYFVCATATVDQTEHGESDLTECKGASVDPRTVVFRTERMSNTSQVLLNQLLYCCYLRPSVSLCDVGDMISGAKLVANLSPTNQRLWGDLLYDMHLQYPTLRMRLHFWYEEDLMAYLEVTSSGVTSLVAVHAPECSSDRCYGHACCDDVPYFTSLRELVTEARADLSIGCGGCRVCLASSTRIAKHIVERHPELRCMVDASAHGWERIHTDMLSEQCVRYLCVLTYLKCADSPACKRSVRHLRTD
jgi:hypothetical protein